MEEYFCCICLDRFPVERHGEASTALACGHRFCEDCIANYLKHQIENGQVSSVRKFKQEGLDSVQLVFYVLGRLLLFFVFVFVLLLFLFLFLYIYCGSLSCWITLRFALSMMLLLFYFDFLFFFVFLSFLFRFISFYLFLNHLSFFSPFSLFDQVYMKCPFIDPETDIECNADVCSADIERLVSEELFVKYGRFKTNR